MLGADGDMTLKNVKEKRDKTLKKEKIKLDLLYFLSINHFEQKMKKRRKNLDESMKRSKDGTYERREYGWKNKYEELYAEYQQNEE